MSTTRSRPFASTAASAALLSLLAGVANAAGLNAMTAKGCYSSSQPLVDLGYYQYQTSGYCQPLCVAKNKPVLATSNGSDCWCGDQLPAANTLVDNSKCNKPCNGYGDEMCGGVGFYTVYLSGIKNDVTNYAGSTSNSGSSNSGSSNSGSSNSGSTDSDSTPAAAAVATPSTSTTAAPSVVTSIAPGATVVVTIPAHADSSTATASPQPSSSSSSGTNVAGIAAGVVIGVLAAIGLIVGALFWVRHRRRRQAEEDYSRANQVNDFMRGERKPPNTGYSNMSDSRLDPEYGRRNSAGSMADNQDYSRRILRVANPDNH